MSIFGFNTPSTPSTPSTLSTPSTPSTPPCDSMLSCAVVESVVIKNIGTINGEATKKSIFFNTPTLCKTLEDCNIIDSKLIKSTNEGHSLKKNNETKISILYLNNKK